jgi:hypothetical protein
LRLFSVGFLDDADFSYDPEGPAAAAQKHTVRRILNMPQQETLGPAIHYASGHFFHWVAISGG